MRVYPQLFAHSALAGIWGDLILLGANDLYEIRAYATDGALSRDYLWVEEYQLPGEPAPAWTVFDAEGRVLGLMELPADVRLFEIGEDHILGSVSDDLGIERVQLWPLARSES